MTGDAFCLGLFTYYVDKILAFLTIYSPPLTFSTLMLTKSGNFLDHLPQSSCKHTGGPLLTRKSLTLFPIPRFLVYVRASGGFLR